LGRVGASEQEIRLNHASPCLRVGGAGTCNATLLHQPKFVTLVSSFGIIREKWLILNNFNECASESQFLLEEFLQHIRSTLLVRKREVPKKKISHFLAQITVSHMEHFI
jgi:hypothetical protein